MDERTEIVSPRAPDKAKNHTELQKIVVQMKDELEKIKEQLLNVI